MLKEEIDSNPRLTEAGFLQLKNLKDYGGKIFGYCIEVDECDSMLSALDDSLAVDIYQDSQPGGGNCFSENRAASNAYEERLDALSGKTVFGALYQSANTDERLVLDALLKAFSNRYADTSYFELNPAYQMMKFMEFACELDFAEKNLTMQDIAVLSAGGDYFRTLVDNSWDVDKGKFTFTPNADTAKRFLIEAGLSKEPLAAKIQQAEMHRSTLCSKAFPSKDIPLQTR